MNINIMQSKLGKVGSSFREPSKLTDNYLYFIRCILGLKNLNTLCIGYGKCPKDLAYKGITSQDVFADYQAFSTRQTGEESTLEKLAVVVAFGSAILLICFSLLVVF